MALFLAYAPDVAVVVAGCGAVLCAAGALVVGNGCRRGCVTIPAAGVVGALLLQVLQLLVQSAAPVGGPAGILQAGLTAVLFFSHWAVYMTVPLLVLGGLQEQSCPPPERIMHAGLMLSSFVCGPVLVPVFLAELG